MAKIDLNTVSSGYLSQAALNNNFTAIEDEFQNKVLYRDNPSGEPNSMQTHLDMNGYHVLNAGNPSLMDADNIAYTADATGAETRTIAEKLNDVVSVKDFGAVGNGVTDDTAAIQAAIDYGYGKTVWIPAGTYKIVDLTIINSITIEMDPNAVLDYSGAAAGTALNQRRAFALNGSLGTTTSLLSNIAVGDRQITFATTGYMVGDWVLIQSAQQFMDGVSSYSTTRGHIARIKSIDSGTTATLTERSAFSYTAASAGTIRKLNTISNVTIRGGTILGGGVGKAHTAISGTCLVDLLVENVNILDFEDCGVATFYSVGPIIKSCRIERCTSPGGSVGNTGYGVVFYSGTRHGQALNNKFSTCRHAVSGGGGLAISTHCLIDGNVAEDNGIGTDGYDCHEPCFWWTFSNNSTQGGQGGFVIRGQYTSLDGNTITGVEGDGITVKSFTTNTDGINGTIIRSNKIYNCGGSGVSIEGTSVTERNNSTLLENNDIRACAFFNVFAEYVFDLSIFGGTYTGTSSSTGTNGTGIRVEGVTNGDNKNVLIDGVQVFGHQRHGIDIRYVDDAVVKPKKIYNVGLGTSGSSAIFLASCSNITITGGNAVHDGTSTQGVIFAENVSQFTVTNCTIVGASGNATQDGIRWSATSGSNSGGIFIGNRISGAGRNAINSSASDRIIALGNDLRGVTGANKLVLTGAIDTVSVNNLI